MFKHFFLAASSVAVLSVASLAQADTFPSKNVTVLVPFVPGGSSDITARTIAPGLESRLKQTFVVENKPGANGAIAAQALKSSKADGYTMMVGSIGTYAINEALYKKLAYKPSEDFDYVSLAVRNPNILVAAPDFPVSSVKELIEYAKKNPGVSFASSGTGSSDHLSAVMFRQSTGVDGVDVPYKGGAAAIVDLMGSQVNVSFQNLGAVLKHIQSGKLKALATTGEARVPELPNVPTMKETGVNDMVVYSWQGFAVPKGTPKDVVNTLSVAIQETLKEPKVKATLNNLGFEVVGSTPQEFTKFQKAEVERWKKAVADANLSVD